MKTPLQLLVCLLLVNISTAQSNKACKSDTVIVEDLNTINKCTATNSKDKSSRRIVLSLNSPNRYLRKRKQTSSKVLKAKEAVQSIAAIDAKGIEKENLASKKVISTSKLAAEKPSNAPLELNEVDVLPVFDGCSSKSSLEVLQCFKQEIASHIQTNFEYPLEALENEITGKITVHFMFTKKGKIKITKVIDQNEDKILGNYTKKLVQKLPKFSPAQRNGEKVSLNYEISLDFSL